jgi:hypothetical protein
VGDLQLQKDLALDLKSSYGGAKSKIFERDKENKDYPKTLLPLP